jgi:Ser/Thr protein kinase RdoA (MazF antagonist)
MSIFDTMAVLPPAITQEAAEAFARDRWGIAATARPLPGERDRNFRLTAADGSEFVLKFANPSEDPGFRTMQIAALRHIEAVDPGLPVPRIVALPDGAAQADFAHPSGETLQVRLLTWVAGLPIGEATPGPAVWTAYGAAIARIQSALAGFDHPARGHEMSWDLQHAPRLREIAFAIPHDGARATLLELLDAYDARVLPAWPSLPRQIVHNDLNRMNVLVDPADHARIAGIIDFGDISHTATIFDLAIAAVSAPTGTAPVTVAIADVLSGYGASRTLLAVERALLPLLMATRIALGLTLASWQRHTQPDNPHFDLSVAAVERRLAVIAALRALPGHDHRTHHRVRFGE